MSKPYDEYISRVISELYQHLIVSEDDDGNEHAYTEIRIRSDNFRNILADAWMDGLKYSLVMIESEKRRRDDRPQD